MWTDRVAASQLQLAEPKEQCVDQRGLRAQARKSELKSSPGPAILLNMKKMIKLSQNVRAAFLNTYLEVKLSVLQCNRRWGFYTTLS